MSDDRGDAPARFLVVGGDAAGMSAATTVRRRCPEVEVVVVERGPYTSYSMCGIPYLVGGDIDEAEDLVAMPPERFEDMGITVRLHTEATAIDAGSRTLRVRDLASGEERDEPFEHLLWAAGAHPAVPDLPGLAEYGHVVHTLDEGEHLRAHLDADGRVERVVVVGVGYVGIEIAEALVQRGKSAMLLDRSTQVLKTIDADLAEHVEQRLVDQGIEVRLGESLVEIRGESGCCREVVTDQGTYPADTVVLAMGHRPNVAIPAEAGCTIGESGALLVDDRMRTTVDRVSAAGDCVESVDLVAGKRVNVQLGTHANKQGKVAGANIAAALRGELPPARFPGVVGTAVTKICSWEIARTGLTVAEAEELGLDYAEVTFTGTAKAGYMPDAGVVHVRMLAESLTGRIIGCQLMGTGNVAKRIDVAAVWCQLGTTVQHAQLFDLAYAPPFGGVWDLLQVAARKLVGKLDLSPKL